MTTIEPKQGQEVDQIILTNDSSFSHTIIWVFKQDNVQKWIIKGVSRAIITKEVPVGKFMVSWLFS